MWLSYSLKKPRVVIADDVGFKDSRYGDALLDSGYIRWWFMRRAMIKRDDENPELFCIMIKTWLGGDSEHLFDNTYLKLISEFRKRGKL